MRYFGVLISMLFVIASPLQSVSLPDTLWTDSHGLHDNPEQGQDIITLPDGGYLFTGFRDQEKLYFGKYSDAGEIEWTNWVPNQGLGVSYMTSMIAAGPNQTYLIASSSEPPLGGPDQRDIAVTRITALGDTLWTQSYGTAQQEDAMAITSDGNTYFVLAKLPRPSTSYRDLHILELTSTGDSINGFTLSNPQYGAFHPTSFSVDSNGDFHITGAVSDLQDSTGKLWYAQVASDGTVLESDTYEDNISLVHGCGVYLPGAGYLLGGSSYMSSMGVRTTRLVRTSLQGDTLWTRTILTGSDDNYIHDLLPVSLGLFLAVGDIDDTPWIALFNDAGQIVDSVHLSNYVGSLNAIRPVPTGFIAVGWDAPTSAMWENILTIRLSVLQGVHYPRIQLVRDIPQDQGHQVRIRWVASDLDGVDSDSTTTAYSIWRRIDQPYVQQKSDMFAEPVMRHDTSREARASDLAHRQESWDFIETVPAIGAEEYGIVAPTLVDSTAAGVFWSVFQVVAHTDNPTLRFLSPPDSGYSVDNLVPPSPSDIEISRTDSAVILSWNAVDVSDVVGYHIYRSETAGFTIDDDHYLGITSAHQYPDSDILETAEYYYRISAVDDAGNESPASGEVHAGIVHVQEADGIPSSYALNQNFPNPFNPTTQITYEIPRQSEVELVVLNVRGENLSTLAQGAHAPGIYTVTWDGSAVASGIYFFQLRTSDFQVKKKGILLK